MLEFKLYCINISKKTITIKNKFYTDIIDFKSADLITTLKKYKNQKWFNDNIFKSIVNSYNKGFEELLKYNEKFINSRIGINTIKILWSKEHDKR